ncbi:MAG: hypothetical protein KDD40_01045 [Bdellovibrionales bacterium]|nr:hypothetical protein [Bdellovibrionales bacterium]
MMYPENIDFWHMGIWPLFGWTALTIGIIFVIFLLIKSEKSYNTPASAMEILNRRLASGDISVNEYRSIKSTINESREIKNTINKEKTEYGKSKTDNQ